MTADLLAAGHHLYDLGDALSWWEFECWLKHLTDGAFVRKIRAIQAEEQAEAAIEKLPEDQRPYGRRTDAMPVDDMLDWLGWTEEGEALGN